MKLAPSFDTFGWFADDIETYETVGKLLLGRDPHQHPLDRPLSIAWLDEMVARPGPCRICRDEGAGRQRFRRTGDANDTLQLVP